MRRIILVTLSFFLVISVFAQTETYSRVKIYLDEEKLPVLSELGIDLYEGIYRPGTYFITEIPESTILKLQNTGLQYEVLIEDMTKFYQDQNIGLSNNIDDYKDAGDWEVPEDFDFGSMSGHCTFDEVVVHLDNMFTKYPNLITAKESIGQSIEGRDLWMVKISDNATTNETEPEVLYTALHHAREPAGVMSLLFYMYYLLENYDDNLIEYLVDNTEMYFVLVVNPDGYVYNETTNPNGGGMWRKNRRDNGNGCWGVDPNRNYGYKWGYNNQGSSPDPCDETYRGTAAFSEPEVAAIGDFCDIHEFKIALNYHTYSNLLLYPWGWTADPCPDDAIFEAFSEIMTMDSHYTYGPGSTTIYPTNGGSDDWMYGEQGTKPAIFAYTPELGGQDDGFWCPINRIIPIAQENMIQNIVAAAFTGTYATVKDITPTLTGELNNYLSFEIRRLGLEDGGTFTVALDPVSPEITSTGGPVAFDNLAMLETKIDSIPYTLEGVSGGELYQFILSVDNGFFVMSDTISKVFGTPVVIFEDPCNSLENWSPGFWDVTTSTFHSPTGSITDSKNGNYSNNQTNICQLSQEIDLTTAAYAQLNFWAQWEIEEGYDYVQVLATATGSSWDPLEGNYTVTGNQYQASGEPVFDGFQTSWVYEEMNLSDYIGGTVKFRFKLKTDTYVTEDGFYFDDLTITVVDIATGETEIIPLKPEISLSEPVPNPTTGSFRIYSFIPESCRNLDMKIFNSAGQEVYSVNVEAGSSTVTVQPENWEKGIYYFRLEGNGFTTETKKLIVL
ncbi:MAG: immune inhibitor A [Bacteroidales bacterium]|nr:immune inhibitor A [Bacteroidales bacterium]